MKNSQLPLNYWQKAPADGTCHIFTSCTQLRFGRHENPFSKILGYEYKRDFVNTFSARKKKTRKRTEMRIIMKNPF
jgi:hypothetical protein